ncbi:MAG: lamin tail domain-containing protein [bacterium]|nr:lamin tail domain-containing protein [bacterium]
MKKLFLSLIILSGIFLFLNNAQATNTDIIITEIGAYEASGYEWVEIYNKGVEDVDMTGWKFWEYGTNHGLSLKQGIDMILGPTEYAIITQNYVSFLSKYPNLNITIIDSSWSSLNESGEEIGLKDSNGNIIEQFTYIEAKNFSLQRKNYSLSDYLENNWVEHASGNTVGADNDFNPAVENNETAQTESIQSESTNNTEVIQTEPEILGYEIGSVVINEFISDPADGEVEFVELYNNWQYSIDLTGWWIEEGAGRKSLLGGTILANGFFVIERPKGNLNNTGDIIKLFDPTGGLIDKVVYGVWDDGNKNDNAPKADDPFSVARVYDGMDTDTDNIDFLITEEITKGKANIIFMEPAVNDSKIITVKSYNFATTTISTSTMEKMQTKSPQVKIEDVKIIISEILPNPTGSDSTEMIELYNPSEIDFDLTGLKLDDDEGGSRPYTFPMGSIIKAGEYKVFGKWDTKIALNNTIDSARLLYNDDTVIDEIDYSSVTEGASFSRDEDDEWQWTTNITAGAKNIYSKPIVKAISSNSSYKLTLETMLSEIRALDVGSRVKTKGIVSVLPNVFGTQYFYITDNISGVQVYMYSKDFPDFKVGDEIQITGEISLAYGETRVKIKNKADIVILGEGELMPQQIEISEISENYEGNLLQITGEVTEKKSTHIYLDDGSEEVKVYFKENANIGKGNFAAGDTLTVVGVLGETTAGFQLMPRSDSDIDLITSSTESVIISENNGGNTTEKYLTATAGGLATILVGLFIRARVFFVGRFFRKFGSVILSLVKRG